MTKYVWTDQYIAFRILRIFTSSYVGLDIKIRVSSQSIHLCLLLIRDCGDMNTPLGRNGLIGLAVGASAAFGFIAFIIYREMKSRRAQRMMLPPRPASQLFDVTDGAARLRDTHDAQGGFSLSHHPSHRFWKIRLRLCTSNANLKCVVTPPRWPCLAHAHTHRRLILLLGFIECDWDVKIHFKHISKY